MESPLKVSGIDHVVFHVKDLARARKFYVDFLGMEVDHERSWQVFLKCGKQGVALFLAKDGSEVHGGSEVNHMALQLDAEHRRDLGMPPVVADLGLFGERLRAIDADAMDIPSNGHGGCLSPSQAGGVWGW